MIQNGVTTAHHVPLGSLSGLAQPYSVSPAIVHELAQTHATVVSSECGGGGDGEVEVGRREWQSIASVTL